MSNEQRYRVFNDCRYDIGVKLLSGIGIVIRPGSFQMMTADDIIYIETSCRHRKFFSEKMLIIKDAQNKIIPLDQVGVYQDESTRQHFSKDEITSILKGSVKKIEEFLSKIEDQSQLHNIYSIAMDMDLPASKIKILSSKMPNKEWIKK